MERPDVIPKRRRGATGRTLAAGALCLVAFAGACETGSTGVPGQPGSARERQRHDNSGHLRDLPSTSGSTVGGSQLRGDVITSLPPDPLGAQEDGSGQGFAHGMDVRGRSPADRACWRSAPGRGRPPGIGARRRLHRLLDHDGVDPVAELDSWTSITTSTTPSRWSNGKKDWPSGSLGESPQSPLTRHRQVVRTATWRWEPGADPRAVPRRLHPGGDRPG